jgi:hypothetical protein
MAKKTLKQYEPALGVASYEHFQNERMHPLLIKQYRVKGFWGMQDERQETTEMEADRELEENGTQHHESISSE